MYNRYIPQPDGSYRKRRIPDPPQRNPDESKPPHPVSPQPPQLSQPEIPPCPPTPQNPPLQSPHPPQKHTDAGDFLRRLLPKDLDTGDLLIILLLLLMAGDCKEEKNTALLTLALYFFL